MTRSPQEGKVSERPRRELAEPKLSWFSAFATYFSYAILILFGHTRDFFAKLTGKSRYYGRGSNFTKKGYAPLLQSWEVFYIRRLLTRMSDCLNSPIEGPPYANCTNVVTRVSDDGHKTFRVTDKTRPMVNLSSYNYLGFADDWKTSCRESVMESLESFPPGVSSHIPGSGRTVLHAQLERTVAKFVGKEDALIFNMGYGTNTSTIPALMGKGDLIISDALNHTSIVNGCRASGSTTMVFKHNDAKHLEKVLRNAIIGGHPITRRAWRKVAVMVEGIYSMEGDICDLAEIVRVTKKYKAYLYVDEAHSIGVLGKTGRGVCEDTGVSPDDIDILMGTFTKSFGGMGGYIASSKKLVDHLRNNSNMGVYSTAMSPVVVRQVLTAFEIISGEDGTDTGQRKLAQIKKNTHYFRDKLREMGMDAFGAGDSPVVIMMIFIPGKMPNFFRMCADRGLAVVVVGFPATSLLLSRVRFCISAGHTKEVLDKSLDIIHDVATQLNMRYRWSGFG